jgi:hypothetical protein
VCRAPHGQPAIAAFAIDQPRAGDGGFGKGVEVNGWVIGRDGPVQGVRTICGRFRSRLYPLDAPRPDVASDYPFVSHAKSSGFSAWAPIAESSDGTCRLEAILQSGEAVTLATIAGSIRDAPRCAGLPEHNPVTAPDFVIIGAQRAGTTSLHAYLSAHPQVRTPAKKELHYLTDRHERGLDWYLGQFPSAVPAGSIVGEATPYALFHPLAPGRLKAIFPNVKLIALLRNPVDRAYSHYLLERAQGFETLDFSAALDAEAERLAGEEFRIIADPAHVSRSHKHFSYLARGDYAPQLARWFSHFPREQILILRSEDLYVRTASMFARVASFLGIDPEIASSFAVHNRSAGAPLDPGLRARLMDYFAPRNVSLTKILGWDPGWNQPNASQP